MTVKVALPVVAVVAGLAGVAIGAQLTTRRERWNLQREIYFDLLKAVFDLEYRFRDVRDEVERLANAGPEMRQRHLDQAQAKADLAQEAFFAYGRAKAVARLIIPSRITRLLDEAVPPFIRSARALETTDLRAAGREIERMLSTIQNELTRESESRPSRHVRLVSP